MQSIWLAFCFPPYFLSHTPAPYFILFAFPDILEGEQMGIVAGSVEPEAATEMGFFFF